ncbi:inorganic phosphate transporter, PiT family [Paracoccus halophilus]|uniref:Phosphate transporter n=1 Tax=Paracoccus halophilus TaxID=376733 RepID=A0A099F2M5_9RHOB|nr:inorganic phosphate transporter [Paracoccus halophilus]KGJ04486.1 phosphate transporter [Paracoccus halophilus]SFA54478.1 inorganic phosphate transporter, PiT family [Paracoccus halophilus]
MAREFRTLDKDLSRVTNAEHAIMQSARPLLRLGIALIFMVAASVTAASLFAGPSSISVVAAGMAVAAYLALSIGANDVANSLGPAVGAGAIGMTTGLLMVAVMEVCGAVIAGNAITATLTEGLVGNTLGQGEATARMMLVALLAAGTWISFATWMNAPVSTTHSVVGAIAGAGLATFGTDAVNWPVLAKIAIGWVASPFIAGLIAAALLALLRNRVLRREDRTEAGRLWLPVLVALSFGLLGAVGALATHGLGPAAVVGIALAAALPGWAYARIRIDRQIRAEKSAPLAMKELLALPLATAAIVMGFAHGANDTANIAAPLTIILEGNEMQAGTVRDALVLLVAGLGIALGIVLFGRRLVHMVGSRITRLNPGRALCVSLTTAITVLGFSSLGLPVSTTHIAVGGVFGIGFYREWRDRQHPKSRAPLPYEERRRRRLVRRSHVRTILGAWLITVPASAILAATLVWIGGF